MNSYIAVSAELSQVKERYSGYLVSYDILQFVLYYLQIKLHFSECTLNDKGDILMLSIYRIN